MKTGMKKGSEFTREEIQAYGRVMIFTIPKLTKLLAAHKVDPALVLSLQFHGAPLEALDKLGDWLEMFEVNENGVLAHSYPGYHGGESTWDSKEERWKTEGEDE